MDRANNFRRNAFLEKWAVIRRSVVFGEMFFLVENKKKTVFPARIKDRCKLAQSRCDIRAAGRRRRLGSGPGSRTHYGIPATAGARDFPCSHPPVKQRRRSDARETRTRLRPCTATDSDGHVLRLLGRIRRSSRSPRSIAPNNILGRAVVHGCPVCSTRTTRRTIC